MTERSWRVSLLALVAVRTVPALVALAFEGDDLAVVPRFDLVTGTGDDAGYYAAAREFISATSRVHIGVAAIAVLAALAVAIVAVRLRPNRRLRPWVVVLAAGTVGLAVSLPILEMRPAGAPVFGWPLAWAAAIFPFRVAGLSLTYTSAFFIALPLGLAANAVAIVATAYAGMYATGRRGVGLAAAAALAAWPLLTRPIAGSTAWDNGTWFVDTGLALYTEPLSTALVATAIALVLRPGRTEVQLALAGVLLSYSAFVKLSNGFTAVLILLVATIGLGARAGVLLAAGGLTFAPAVAAYWPLGYADEEDGRRHLLPADPYSIEYGWQSWGDSILFSPRTLVVLLPLAILGGVLLRHRPFELSLLLAPIVGNVAVYTFYGPTDTHPRFFFASLPAFFVLWAVGAAGLVERISMAFARGHPPPSTPLH